MIPKFRIAAALATAVGALLILAAPANADSGAQGAAVDSPGVASVAEAPVHVPVNACGNSTSIVGLLNPTFGNTCVND
jgi:hypothetical protein